LARLLKAFLRLREQRKVGMPGSAARVLEIGDYSYFKIAYPERVTLLWTGWRPHNNPAANIFDCTPARFARAIRDVHAGRYDLVVTYLPLRPSWHPRYWVRAPAQTPLKPFTSFIRVFGVSWLRMTRIPIPLVAIDMNDHFGIGRHNFFLFDNADVIFKRELPADRWQVLTHSAHPALPTLRIRRAPLWKMRLQKLRPIPLPSMLLDTARLWAGDFPEKTTDVFFSGNLEDNSWVRRSGRYEIQALKARGVNVDVPKARLPQDEFYRRMSRAWLAWAPSGFGWECYRPAEAAQCLAVPVVNHPTIERHRPLLDGEHMIQYDVEPGGLVRAVEAALVDKERLRRMALAARQHVLEHHTLHALVDHVIETGLSYRQGHT
jgi:glycosyltransferase involved in cell wall biosynthesis